MINKYNSELKLPGTKDILAKHVAESAQDGRIPGAAFVVTSQDGNIIDSSASGFRKPGSDLHFTTDTVCFIASMTKLVTSVAAIQVVERGLVGLEDDLAQVVPELSHRDVLKDFAEDGSPIFEKQTKPLTLCHLLSHTSGFGYDVLDPDLVKWRKWTGSQITCNSFSRESLDIPLKFQPGEGWLYGISLEWAGRVVEILTGQSLEQYMQINIFKPLGMNSTTFRITEHPELESRRAVLAARDPKSGLYSTVPNFKPDVTSLDCGGVGLYSTATDYAKLLTALLNNGGSILKPETVNTLLTWQIPNSKHAEKHLFGELHAIFAPEFSPDTPSNYGLCGAINCGDLREGRRKGSLMWHGMANPRWWLDRETGIAATLFVQVLPPGDADVSKLYKHLEQAVYQYINGGKEEDGENTTISKGHDLQRRISPPSL